MRFSNAIDFQHEQFEIEDGGIRFSSATVENKISIQNLVPKVISYPSNPFDKIKVTRIVFVVGMIFILNFIQVQFNLLLSEKEIADRSKVVLPFEHQGMHLWESKGFGSK